MAEFDLIVIGSGPSGRRAAVQAAKLGKRALVVERRTRVGALTWESRMTSSSMMVWAIWSETTATASKPIASMAWLAASSPVMASHAVLPDTHINSREMAMNSSAMTPCMPAKNLIRIVAIQWAA